MKLLLISDTHGRTDNLESLLELYKNTVGYVFHMGDYGSDLRKFERKYPHLKMVSVNGNTDSAFYGSLEEVVLLEPKNGAAKKILIVHGHKFGVKTGLDRLLYYTKEIGAGAVFFGHTHEAVCFTQDGIFLMNPGSLTFPKNRHVTYGVVDFTADGEFAGEVMIYEE